MCSTVLYGHQSPVAAFQNPCIMGMLSFCFLLSLILRQKRFKQLMDDHRQAIDVLHRAGQSIIPFYSPWLDLLNFIAACCVTECLSRNLLSWILNGISDLLVVLRKCSYSRMNPFLYKTAQKSSCQAGDQVGKLIPRLRTE